MTTAMMSQPQNREASEPNNFCKIGPNCDFKIDPPPGVCCVLLVCRRAGSDLQLFSFPGTPPQFCAPCFTPVLMKAAPSPYGNLTSDAHCKK